MLLAMALAAALSTEPPERERVELTPRTTAQIETFRALEPEVCYSGRRFGGKSWIGCLKAYVYACRYEGARVALCREERSTMDTSTLQTLREEIVPAAVWARFWNEGKSALILPNGSQINVFGLDKPERALGARYGLIVVDQAEQIDFEQFQIIASCCMQVGMPFHQVLLLFNPAHPQHWAYQRFQPDAGDGLRRDAEGRVFARVVHVTPEDLLEYLTDITRFRFDSYEGVFRLRYRLGLWVAFEGLVFRGFDPAVHVAKRPEEWARWGGNPPPSWPRQRGLDWGVNNPSTCVWIATDPDGNDWVYRQWGRTGHIPSDVAAVVNRLEAEELTALRNGVETEDEARALKPYLDTLNLEGSWSDHELGWRGELERNGVWTNAAEKDIHQCIAAIEFQLRVGLSGVPRLRICDDSLVEPDPTLVAERRPSCLQEEMVRYMRRDWKEGQADSKRELPFDRDNHWIDSLGYVLNSRAEHHVKIGYFG